MVSPGEVEIVKNGTPTDGLFCYFVQRGAPRLRTSSKILPNSFATRLRFFSVMEPDLSSSNRAKIFEIPEEQIVLGSVAVLKRGSRVCGSWRKKKFFSSSFHRRGNRASGKDTRRSMPGVGICFGQGHAAQCAGFRVEVPQSATILREWSTFLREWSPVVPTPSYRSSPLPQNLLTITFATFSSSPRILSHLPASPYRPTCW